MWIIFIIEDPGEQAVRQVHDCAFEEFGLLHFVQHSNSLCQSRDGEVKVVKIADPLLEPANEQAFEDVGLVVR